MRVIITGGTGLIGRALTQSLAADGHEAIVLSRNPDKVTGLPKGARTVKWDGRSAQGWGQLADGADAIVNLAGESIAAGRWSEARKQSILRSRVEAGQAVVAAVEAATKKPRVVVQSSAVGFYGPRGSEKIAEDASAGSDFLASVCRAWEASTAALEALGVRRVIIRTGVVLDKQGGALPQMMLPFKLFSGGPLGGGRQGFPWIHLADEVAAIRFLIDQPSASGVFNLSAPNPLSNAQFSRVLGKVLGRPAFVPTPGLAMKMMFGEMSTLLLDGQFEIPQRLQQLGFTFRFPDADAALRDVLK
jgi:uncharacterized protein